MYVIHHWDTDGICSAAKLIDIHEPENYGNITPPIGEFSFDDRIRDALKMDDEIFIVDLNLPGVAEELEREVTFIDHHHQPRIANRLVTQINPLLSGGSPEDYPSATAVISEFFGSWDLLSVLGAVGDVGKMALENGRIRMALEGSPLDMEQVSRLVELIDSNYISMDRLGVESAVSAVLEEDPLELLENREWNDKLEKVKNSVEEALSSITELNGFAYIEMRTGLNIISKVARKATWELGYPGAIVVNRDFNGKAQTYFRIRDNLEESMDLPSLIEKLRSIGVNAGGKKVVVGSVYEKERMDEVLSLIKDTAGIDREI